MAAYTNKIPNTLLIATFGLSILVACDSGSKPTPKAADINQNPINPGGCGAPQQSIATNTVTSTSTNTSTLGFALVDTFGPVKTLLQSSTCSSSSCHSSTTKTKFTDNESIKAVRYDISDVAKGSTNVPHSQLNLTTAQIQTFTAWANDGHLVTESTTTSTSTSSSTNTAGNTTTTPVNNTVNPCPPVQSAYSSTSTTISTTDDFADLRTPAKKTECNNAKQMFNRDVGGSCFANSVLDSSWCSSKATIRAKFQATSNSGASFDQVLASATTALGKGEYQVDECGMINGKPAASFYYLDTAEEKIYQLLINPK